MIAALIAIARTNHRLKVNSDEGERGDRTDEGEGRSEVGRSDHQHTGEDEERAGCDRQRPRERAGIFQQPRVARVERGIGRPGSDPDREVHEPVGN